MTSNPNWIRLNVGGTVFETSKQTLGQHSASFLARLVSDDQTIPSEKDESGAILIDRDPEYFKVLLNLLRTGRLILPERLEQDQLMEEADFYGVPLNPCTAQSNQTNPRSVFETIEVAYFDTETRPQQFRILTTNVSHDYEVIQEMKSERRSLNVLRARKGRYRVKLDEQWEHGHVRMRLHDSIMSFGFTMVSNEDKKWTYTRAIQQ